MKSPKNQSSKSHPNRLQALFQSLLANLVNFVLKVIHNFQHKIQNLHWVIAGMAPDHSESADISVVNNYLQGWAIP